MEEITVGYVDGEHSLKGEMRVGKRLLLSFILSKNLNFLTSSECQSSSVNGQKRPLFGRYLLFSVFIWISFNWGICECFKIDRTENKKK